MWIRVRLHRVHHSPDQKVLLTRHERASACVALVNKHRTMALATVMICVSGLPAHPISPLALIGSAPPTSLTKARNGPKLHLAGLRYPCPRHCSLDGLVAVAISHSHRHNNRALIHWAARSGCIYSIAVAGACLHDTLNSPGTLLIIVE